MNDRFFHDPFALREIFHLDFLRWLGRRIALKHFAVKGGANLRFFYGSRRYSEDLDIDIIGVQVSRLKSVVMKLLETPTFQAGLRACGIERIVSPDIARAKQAETTQRFKIHLITSAGENLLSTVEFSRRGFRGQVKPEFVSEMIVREYKMPPLLVPHYDLNSTILQKIEALATRSEVQARDIFDLHLLSTQYSGGVRKSKGVRAEVARAKERLYEVGFHQFRDTVLFYLAAEDQAGYDSPSTWEEIKLEVSRFLDEIGKDNA